MRFQIAREGTTIGEFEEKDIPSGLASGRLKSTDHYFGEGMVEWRSLTDFSPAEEPPPPSAPLPPPPPPKSTSYPSEDSFAQAEAISISGATDAPIAYTPSRSPISPGSGSQRSTSSGFKDVKGWLWVFCMIVAVIHTISFLGAYILSWPVVSLFGRQGQLGLSMIYLLPLDVIMAGYALWVGCSLYGKLKKIPTEVRLKIARRRASVYLWTFFTYNLVRSLAFSLDGAAGRILQYYDKYFGTSIPAPTDGELFSNLLWDLFISAIFLAIWLNYWKRSKRVEAVYGTA